jgi:hypothetical protein
VCSLFVEWHICRNVTEVLTPENARQLNFNSLSVFNIIQCFTLLNRQLETQ